jgi:tetratricopeptide (TPR) repeat protein
MPLRPSSGAPLVGAALIAAAAAAVALGARPAAAATGGVAAGRSGAFWGEVAGFGRDRADRIVWDARQIPARPDSAARIEALLRQALAVDPTHFPATFFLAEVQSMNGRAAAAADTLELALRLARFPQQRAQALVELAIVRTKLGQFRRALACYDLRIELGDADAGVYANAAELAMALGRLGEAEARYRDAIRIDDQAQVADRRDHEHGLALSHYGLGVALDRDGQAAAAREMIGRALALDPGAALLQGAGEPGSPVFFSPEGDVFYYLGLAWEVAGRARDGEEAFRDFLAREPKSPWAARARAHADALAAAAARPGPAPAAPPAAAPRWRVLAVATVAAHGPVAAPLVDAAWRQRAPAVADCLAAVPGPAAGVGGTVRVDVDIDIDGRGAVTRATAAAPPPLPAGVGVCIEDAVRRTLQVARPARPAATSARVELLLGWAVRAL